MEPSSTVVRPTVLGERCVLRKEDSAHAMIALLRNVDVATFPVERKKRERIQATGFTLGCWIRECSIEGYYCGSITWDFF